MAKPSRIAMDQEIAALQEGGLDLLRQRWSELFGLAPPPRFSRDLLIRGAAFRLQEDACGGLSKAVRRQLGKLAADLGNGATLTPSSPSFKPGTKLIREWKGKVHEVVIAGDTYIWNGKHYRSLSQIARAITGTRWSGPRFFGLDRTGATDDASDADE